MKMECDACEEAPATVICGADEAALCGRCDVEVHAANKVAGRHQRLLLQHHCNNSPSPTFDACQVQSPQNISQNLFRDVQQQNKNQKVSRNVAWRVKEDVALMTSWCSVSGAMKCGKFGKGSLWAQVHRMYTYARNGNPEELNERNVESLKGRWKRLNENANKWIAAYRKAYSRKSSEMSPNDIEKEAHTIYEADGASKFHDLFLFNEIMSKNEKWDLKLDHVSTHDENEVDNEESGDSSKRARINEEGDYSTPYIPITPDSGCSTIPHPVDRVMTKGKEEGTTSQFVATAEVAAEIRAMGLAKESKVEVLSSTIPHPVDRVMTKVKEEGTTSQFVATAEVAAEIHAMRLAKESEVEVLSSTIPHPVDRVMTKGKEEGTTSQFVATAEVAAEIRAMRLAKESDVEVLSSTIPHPVDRVMTKGKEEGTSSQFVATAEVAAEIRAMRLAKESDVEVLSSTIPHPVDRVTTKGKEEGTSSQFVATAEVAAEIRAMRLAKESEVEVLSKLGRDIIELQNKKEQRKIMKINSNLLMSLLAKDKLSLAEEEMKLHLMKILCKQSM